MKKLYTILIIIFLIGIVIAGVSVYPDKEIILTKEQKNALAIKNLTSYTIKDSLVIIKGEARTSRCIIANSRTIRCFNVKNGNLNQADILVKLDEAEKKVIIQEANNIIRQLEKEQNPPVEIGEGKTIIK